MVERPVRRCEIRWLNNIYYAPELRDEHGRKVLISYDIHDAERITVRRPDGSVICEAVWDGNKREAFLSARNTTNSSSALKACVNAQRKNP